MTDRDVPPAPLPHDKGGWRVAPAPDGRGMPAEHKPPPPHRQRWFWIFVIVLLAINWLSVLMAQTGGQPRVKIPFSPYFLDRVQAGQVKSISSKSGTIQGIFTTKLRYPPSDTKATPTTLFSTQVPSFWNNASFAALLQDKKVEVNAQNPNPGMSLLGELLLGFGPWLLLIGLFCSSRAGRRAAPEGSAAWAISAARRPGGRIPSAFA
jgi:cell division protease FtsH